MTVTTIICMIGIAVAGAYFVSPLISRAATKLPARRDFVPREGATDDELPALSGAMEAAAGRLEGEGFRRVADLRCGVPDQTSERRLLLRHPSTGDVALVTALHLKRVLLPAWTSHVTFIAAFRDGRHVLVTNSPYPDIFDARPPSVSQSFGEVRDPVRLWRIGRALAARTGPEGERVPLDPAGDPAGFIEAVTNRQYSHLVDGGLLWLDEKAGAFRPTLKGCFLLAWRILPPLVQIRQRRARRRARELLGDPGLAGPDPSPIPVGRFVPPYLRMAAVWAILALAAGLLVHLSPLVAEAGAAARSTPPPASGSPASPAPGTSIRLPRD